MPYFGLISIPRIIGETGLPKQVDVVDAIFLSLCIVKICESVREDYSVITHNIYHLFTGSCWRCLLV